MGERKYAILSLCGFIVLAIIFVANYDAEKESRAFAVGEYYEPVEREDSQLSALLQYQDIVSGKLSACPVTKPTKSKYSIDVVSIVGARANLKYDSMCFFLTSKSIGYSGRLLVNDAVVKDTGATGVDPRPAWLDYLKLIPAGVIDANFNLRGSKIVEELPCYKSETTKISDMIPSGGFEEDEVLTIVAPFNFRFVNINTTSTNSEGKTSIIITNTKGNCRITFSNVLNWFCAGEYDDTSIWKEHGVSHNTIIGYTENAEVKGGQAGYIIGYATKDTNVVIEKYEEGSWLKMSLYEFMTTTE